jgi:hypothetical protein
MGNADNMIRWGEGLQRYDLRKLPTVEDDANDEDPMLEDQATIDAIEQKYVERCEMCFGHPEAVTDEEVPACTCHRAEMKEIFRPCAFHWYYKCRSAIDVHNHLRLGLILISFAIISLKQLRKTLNRGSLAYQELAAQGLRIRARHLRDERVPDLQVSDRQGTYSGGVQEPRMQGVLSPRTHHQPEQWQPARCGSARAESIPGTEPEPEAEEGHRGI